MWLWIDDCCVVTYRVSLGVGYFYLEVVCQCVVGAAESKVSVELLKVVLVVMEVLVVMDVIVKERV